MRNFNSGNRSRDRRDSSRRNFGGRDFGGRDSGRPLLHDAVCDECGKDCQVPFRPSGDKPIYCSDCFEKKGGRDSGRSSWRGSRNRSFDHGDSRGSSGGNTGDRGTLQLAEKIGTLNTKLDRIIDLLASGGEKKPSSIEVRSRKNKKLSKPKADKMIEVVSTVKDKEIDLTASEAKVKPKKKSRKPTAKS